MMRPVMFLNLPDSARTKLQSLGYEYIEDIERALNGTDEMCEQLKAIINEHNIAEKVISYNRPTEIITAAHLWHLEVSNPPVPVFHEGLDKLLDGGLSVGQITELCGAPGSGKTQMCLQFCVDVQMPSELGGAAGEALYISTDFGFRVERLREICNASVEHCRTIPFPDTLDKKVILEKFSVESLCNGVNVLFTHELNDLILAVKNLPEFLETNQVIKLMIIDSFSLPLVIEVEDLILRSKIIAETLSLIQNLAITYKLAVVLTNQLMTVIKPNNKAILKPSLGESFGHRMHKRLLLDDSKIYLTKSINHSQLFARFEITKDGIR